MNDAEATHSVREGLALTLSATRRLSHPTRQLLTLARSEQDMYHSGDFGPVDLAQIAEACVSDYLASAINAKLDLGADLQPTTVLGMSW